MGSTTIIISDILVHYVLRYFDDTTPKIEKQH